MADHWDAMQEWVARQPPARRPIEIVAQEIVASVAERRVIHSLDFRQGRRGPDLAPRRMELCSLIRDARHGYDRDLDDFLWRASQWAQKVSRHPDPETDPEVLEWCRRPAGGTGKDWNGIPVRPLEPVFHRCARFWTHGTFIPRWSDLDGPNAAGRLWIAMAHDCDPRYQLRTLGNLADRMRKTGSTPRLRGDSKA
ncbi:MAG: hypothetical protein U1E40_10245 [Amaricoccus sp.]